MIENLNSGTTNDCTHKKMGIHLSKLRGNHGGPVVRDSWRRWIGFEAASCVLLVAPRTQNEGTFADCVGIKTGPARRRALSS